MAGLKRDFVSAAYGEIGFESDFDLTPEQLQSGLRRLDDMMASWNGDGIRLGWPIPATPGGGDLDEETNVTDRAREAIVANLALRIASRIGRAVSQDLRVLARGSYKALLAKAVSANTQQVQMPGGQPLGAGNRRGALTAGEFTTNPPETLDIGTDEDSGFELEE